MDRHLFLVYRYLYVHRQCTSRRISIVHGIDHFIAEQSSLYNYNEHDVQSMSCYGSYDSPVSSVLLLIIDMVNPKTVSSKFTFRSNFFHQRSKNVAIASYFKLNFHLVLRNILLTNNFELILPERGKHANWLNVFDKHVVDNWRSRHWQECWFTNYRRFLYRTYLVNCLGRYWWPCCVICVIFTWSKPEWNDWWVLGSSASPANLLTIGMLEDRLN